MPNLTIDVAKVLEDDALLSFNSPAISKDRIHLPGPDFVDRIVAMTDRNQGVLNNYHRILNTGRLAGTGYTSILPVDQGIEHSAGASFAPNPDYFDPEKIVQLAEAQTAAIVKVEAALVALRDAIEDMHER